jgi:uncharacterized cupin superfamily protein
VVEISVVRSTDRSSWRPLADPPGEIPSSGRDLDVFVSSDGSFSCGFWEREPDRWSFERPHDEVAFILEGATDIETDDGRTLHVGRGDILVTPKGSKGTWNVHETLVKFFAIYAGGEVGDTRVRVFGRADPVEWVELENPPGDENPPGREWYAWRNADGRFSTGVWAREPETGALERPYHEVALLIQGDVEIETREGRLLRVGPGDALITPEGSTGVWRARTPVEKFWAVHHE